MKRYKEVSESNSVITKEIKALLKTSKASKVSGIIASSIEAAVTDVSVLNEVIVTLQANLDDIRRNKAH